MPTVPVYSRHMSGLTELLFKHWKNFRRILEIKSKSPPTINMTVLMGDGHSKFIS